MAEWTKLVRFVGRNGSIRLGQPVDLTLDVGVECAEGEEVQVNVVEGDVFSGTVTSDIDVIKKLLSPVSREECSIIRCLGLNYKAHAKEAGMALPEDPILFIKPRTALAGPGELSVAKAAQDDPLDFETELALVMGRDATDVKEADALDYVLGYTCSNDVSVSKFHLSNSQWHIIQMGTPSGIGWAREPKRINKDGEDMRIWIEGVGTLINTFKYA